MWDTTNAIITHLDLPFRAASVQDLFEPIVKFVPNDIEHILNSNLIFLTIKAAYLVYREKAGIIAKNNNIDRKELNKRLFKARRKIYSSALFQEIHYLPIHEHQIMIHERSHAKQNRLTEREKLLIPMPQIDFDLNNQMRRLYQATWLKSDFFDIKDNKITMQIPPWPT